MVREFPTGIYTSPEISSLGRTERELTADNVPYEIGHALFRSLARAQIIGRTTLACSALSSTAKRYKSSAFTASEPTPREIIPHRAGHRVAKRLGQFADVFHQHDIQLPHNGRSLPCGGAEWLQPVGF